MTPLPNPWLSDSIGPRSAQDSAVASSPVAPPCDAAAEQFLDLDDTDCIGEIFVGAQRLEPCDTPEPSILELMARGFNLEAFLADCEPAPMFLRGAA